MKLLLFHKHVVLLCMNALSFLQQKMVMHKQLHFSGKKHRKAHAPIREQLPKYAHLPDPMHAGTKYPVRENPSLRLIQDGQCQMMVLENQVSQGFAWAESCLQSGSQAIATSSLAAGRRQKMVNPSDTCLSSTRVSPAWGNQAQARIAQDK